MKIILVTILAVHTLFSCNGNESAVDETLNFNKIVEQKYLKGDSLFRTYCAVCHNADMVSRSVAPALGESIQLYPREWLYRFIRSSQTMIKADDSLALVAFDKGYKMIMTEFPQLTDGEIEAILLYIENKYKQNKKGIRLRPISPLD